jgi:hypothetical protein
MTSLLAKISGMSQSLMVGDGASKFEVAIVDSAARVGVADQVGRDMGGKTLSPNQGTNTVVSVMDKVHSAHAKAGGITGTDAEGWLGHNFCQATPAEVPGEPPKVRQEVMDLGGEP